MWFITYLQKQMYRANNTTSSKGCHLLSLIVIKMSSESPMSLFQEEAGVLMVS